MTSHDSRDGASHDLPAGGGRTYVIVGGGISGLTAAWHLLGRGIPGSSITLLDAERTGGKLRRGTVGGEQVDVGAEAMLAFLPAGTELVQQVGLGEELTTPTDAKASVYSRGAQHALPAPSLMGVPADPQAALGILTADEVARLADEQPVDVGDDMSVGDLLDAALGPAVTDRLVEPLLGGVYAGHARLLSAAATVPAVWKAATSGTGILTAARALADRPRSNRAAFAGVVGGMGLVAEQLTEKLREAGVSVLEGTIAREIERLQTGWRVVTGPVPDPTVHEATHVLLAVPAAPAARLLRPLAPDAAEALGEIETASMAVVTLALPRERCPHLEQSGVLIPPVEDFRIKASTFSASKWAWVDDAGARQGVVHLRASLGRHRQEEVLQRSDAELVDTVRSDLARITGPLPAPVDSHVQRWGGGLPQYAVGHHDRIARIETAVASVPGLEVTGAWAHGVGIPACISAARAAADRLAEPTD